MGLPAIEDLSALVERHPCYTASHLQSIDIMGHLTLRPAVEIHEIHPFGFQFICVGPWFPRSMAVALGSNMFRGSNSQVPAFWLPPWVEHPAHSSAACDTTASLSWYHAPPLPRLSSLLQKGRGLRLQCLDSGRIHTSGVRFHRNSWNNMKHRGIHRNSLL